MIGATNVAQTIYERYRRGGDGVLARGGRWRLFVRRLARGARRLGFRGGDGRGGLRSQFLRRGKGGLGPRSQLRTGRKGRSLLLWYHLGRSGFSFHDGSGGGWYRFVPIARRTRRSVRRSRSGTWTSWWVIFVWSEGWLVVRVVDIVIPPLVIGRRRRRA